MDSSEYYPSVIFSRRFPHAGRTFFKILTIGIAVSMPELLDNPARRERIPKVEAEYRPRR
jgi:hypothetical protein